MISYTGDRSLFLQEAEDTNLKVDVQLKGK